MKISSTQICDLGTFYILGIHVLCAFYLFQFEDGKEISFDATAFKTAMTSYGGLTSRARKALKKVPEERNNDDAKILLVGAIGLLC